MNLQQATGVCSACQQPIIGPALQAFNMLWHADHLLCKVCQKPFLDFQVCEGTDGFAYCPADWKRTFCPPCGHCNEPIEGATINALAKSYHPDHFVCFMCKTLLAGQYFASPDGQPLCEKDYYDAQNLLCGGCGKPIVAGKVITLQGQNGGRDQKFHLEHFECSHCKKGLANDKYKRRKGKQYCLPCHLKLFE